MMSDKFVFELALLSRMSERYRGLVQQEIGLSSDDVAQRVARCSFRVPEDLGSGIAAYRTWLGREIPSGHVGYVPAKELAESVPHCFLLFLWPHLYWVVHERPDGSSWEAGFQNQTEVTLDEVHPLHVRPGLWTRAALQRIADDYHLYDGWDEQVAVRFTFDGREFEGLFVFGLLQSWRAV